MGTTSREGSSCLCFHFSYQVVETLILSRFQKLGVKFSVVAKDTIQHLQGKVAALSFLFNILQKSNTLNIVKKTTHAVGLTNFRKKPLPVVAERGVADVMAQGDGLREIFIEPEKSGDGPGDLADQLHM
jgi:hypothetical protein